MNFGNVLEIITKYKQNDRLNWKVCKLINPAKNHLGISVWWKILHWKFQCFMVYKFRRINGQKHVGIKFKWRFAKGFKASLKSDSDIDRYEKW